jgi:hypothetical protein
MPDATDSGMSVLVHSLSVAYGTGTGSAGQLLPSCFKIGPYSPHEHPQDVLTGRGDDGDLSWMRDAVRHYRNGPPVQRAHVAEGSVGHPSDGDAEVEITASASDGSDKLQRSGSPVTVEWKGVPWLAVPFEYWVWAAKFVPLANVLARAAKCVPHACKYARKTNDM